MIALSDRALDRLVRLWARVYCTGASPDARRRRLGELESDLWEQSSSGTLCVRQKLVRWLHGIPDDILWRMEADDAEGRQSMIKAIFSPWPYLRYAVSLAVMSALFPIGVGTFVLALLAAVVPFALISTPVTYRVWDMNVVHWRIDSLPEAFAACAVGLAVLVIELALVQAVFRALRGKVAVRIGGLKLGQ